MKFQRYAFKAHFKDLKYLKTGYVQASVIFYPDSEGYIEKLTVYFKEPDSRILTLVELDEEDLKNIESQLELRTPHELIQSDEYIRILKSTESRRYKRDETK